MPGGEIAGEKEPRERHRAEIVPRRQHELSEARTDPRGDGWFDSGGAENGDKCAWISSGQGASANVSLNGKSFPVQSLWSNAFNSNAGGCVLSY